MMTDTKLDIRIDNPVLIIDGYITIDLPELDLKITQAVKQVKGRGTHDAIKLKGLVPDLIHYAIMKMMFESDETDLTAEDIRVLTRAVLYKNNEPVLLRKFDHQSWFQRKHSELLYWKVIYKTGSKNGIPLYAIDMDKAHRLLNGETFG